MGNWKVKWKGLHESIDGLRKFPKVLNEELKTAKEEVLEPIFERSQELVPVQTGELKASGQIDTEKGSIIYHARHAAIVHEDLAMQHDDGQAKFLETAFNENQKSIEESMRNAVEIAFKKIVKK